MKRLYVGNLPYSATEAEVESWFGESSVGVDKVTVMRDRFSGEGRGFGFVEIGDDDAAERAIGSCNGKQFQGRRLVVNEARPPREEGGGGGGGGGRGRSRGGGGY